MPLDTEWYDERIAATKEAIAAYEAGILALGTGAQTYSLDTGQTRQTVTKANLGSMRLQLRDLYTQLDFLCHRRDGDASVRVIPAF